MVDEFVVNQSPCCDNDWGFIVSVKKCFKLQVPFCDYFYRNQSFLAGFLCGVNVQWCEKVQN